MRRVALAVAALCIVAVLVFAFGLQFALRYVEPGDDSWLGQLVSWWGCVGTVQAMTGKSGWGVMKRRAFESGAASPG